jgi:hypothetical protein
MASKGRTEYRVIGENDADEQWERPFTENLAEAEREAKNFRDSPRTRNWNRWVRIQSRTVTETPWTDLAEEPHTDE